MSENVRTKASLARLSKIKQGIVDGKTYGEIAEDCEVTPRTIYRDRQSIAYHELLNEITDQYLQGLREFRECDDPAVRFAAVRELGFQVRAMTRAAIPQKIETKAEVEVKLPELDIGQALEDYAPVLVKIVLDEEARRTRETDERDPDEPVDTAAPDD